MSIGSLLLAALVAIQFAPSAMSRPQTATQALRVVALGESDASGSGDPTRQGWVVGRYGRLLGRQLGVKVVLKNLAEEGQTSGQLLSAVRSDAYTRGLVRSADVVLFGAGGADLNAGDDRWQAGACSGPLCYAGDIQRFGRNLAATVAEVRRLRGTKRTALRAVTLPNAYPGALDVLPSFLRPTAVQLGVFQFGGLRKQICSAMLRYNGRCIDVMRVFNGPAGTEDAYKKGLMNHSDCCYANAKGQQLMAELLLKTGIAPVRP